MGKNSLQERIAPHQTGQAANETLTRGIPRSLAITQRGIRTGADFAALMSALMGDVIEGTISPMIANATVNAGGKLLKVVEMEYRYGKEPRVNTLLLTVGE